MTHAEENDTSDASLDPDTIAAIDEMIDDPDI